MPKRAYNRRSFLKNVGMGAAAMALPGCVNLRRPAASKIGKRPNFVVVLCDDLGYGDLGCFGHPTIRTPHLDKLAARGVRLTDCYSAAPVCSPARVGMHTGRIPVRAGVCSWISSGPEHMRASEITIATLLRNAGYDTCHVGKWHCNRDLTDATLPQPGDHGFSHWFSTQDDAYPWHYRPENFVRNGQEVGRLEGYSCRIVVDEAIDWLGKGRDRDNPFFLHVCFHEPHEPIASPAEMVGKYGQVSNKDEALYYANVSNMDRAFGKLMAALEAQGLADNTLVFFTSDNGPETLNRYPGAQRSYGSPGPLRGMKLHIYEGGIRVPGILYWPGYSRPGSICKQPISGVDVLPTFCEMAQVEAPSDRAIDGASFLPVLSGRNIKRRTPLFWHYYRAIGRAKVAMRQGDWKIVAHWDHPTVLQPGAVLHPGDIEMIKQANLVNLELYRLSSDIGETTDLASSHPDRLASLAQEMVQLNAEVVKDAPVWDFS